MKHELLNFVCKQFFIPENLQCKQLFLVHKHTKNNVEVHIFFFSLNIIGVIIKYKVSGCRI